MVADSIGFSTIKTIVDATVNGSLRPQIAKLAECSKITVWSYQKKLGLL